MKYKANIPNRGFGFARRSRPLAPDGRRVSRRVLLLAVGSGQSPALLQHALIVFAILGSLAQVASAQTCTDTACMHRAECFDTESGTIKQHIGCPSTNTTVEPDYNTSVTIRVRKASACANVTYYCTDMTNGIQRRYPATGTTTDAYHDFSDCVGSSTPAEIWAYVNTVSGLVRFVVDPLPPEFPDLIVSAVTVDNSTEPRTYHEGETVPVKCIVWNNGQGSARSSHLAYYFGDSCSDTSRDPWGTDYVDALDPGGPSPEGASYTFEEDDVGSDRYFVLWADYQNVVDEGPNENNNVSCFGPFTVTCALPPAASSPTPCDGCTEQNENVQVCWASVPGATDYEVYFGTDPSPDQSESKGPYPGPCYDPGPLPPSTTYYWQIDPRNPCGSSHGPVWQFTTAAPTCSVTGIEARINDALGPVSAQSDQLFKLAATLSGTGTCSASCRWEYRPVSDSVWDSGTPLTIDLVNGNGVFGPANDRPQGSGCWSYRFSCDSPNAITSNEVEVCVSVPTQQFEVGSMVFRDKVTIPILGEVNWHVAVLWFYDGFDDEFRVIQANGFDDVLHDQDWQGFLFNGAEDGQYMGAREPTGVFLTERDRQKVIYAARSQFCCGYSASAVLCDPSQFDCDAIMPAVNFPSLSYWNVNGEGLGKWRCDYLVRWSYFEALGISFQIQTNDTPRGLFGALNAGPVTVERPTVTSVKQPIYPDSAVEIEFSELMSTGTLHPDYGAAVSIAGSSHGPYEYGAEDVTFGYEALYGRDDLFRYSPFDVNLCENPPSPDNTLGRRNDCRSIRIDPVGKFSVGETLIVSVSNVARDLGGNPLNGPFTTSIVVQCRSSADCDDGVFCNGMETCDSSGSCQPGSGDPCVGTNRPYCDSANSECDECRSASDCDDGDFCNGMETCDSSGSCQPGGGDPCVGTDRPYCDSANSECHICRSDSDCDDGDFCNGIETCDPSGNCQPGRGDPCVGTNRPYCDSADGECDLCRSDSDCDDGDFCNGVETCGPTGDCDEGEGNPCQGTDRPYCDDLNSECDQCRDYRDCPVGMFCNERDTCECLTDTDADGICDDTDNCICVPNPSQCDADEDGIGNLCDPDLTNDGVVGIPDFNAFRACFGSREGDANFDPACDFDCDGVVGIPDFNVLRSYFGGAPGGSNCTGSLKEPTDPNREARSVR